MSPQTPPTDRPLTAGEPLWMVHVLGPDDIYPAPDHATAVDWCAGINGAIPDSDVLCVAVPALWTGSSKDHAAGLKDAREAFAALARPATSAASEVEGAKLGDVERLVLAVMPSDGMCYSFAALEAQLEDDRPTPERPIIEAAVRLLSARGLLRFQRGLFNEDGCTYGSGYGLTDKGLTKQAVLASPPVSERERELEGAISPVLSGVLSACPTDEDAGDLEGVEVSFTRRQIKTLCAMFGVDPVTGEPV